MGSLCLVENLSCQEFQICYKLHAGHFDEDALAKAFSLGIKLSWARTQLVSLAVKPGCQFVLEIEYGKGLCFSMPFYIVEPLGLLFGSHILHLRRKVRETLVLFRILFFFSLLIFWRCISSLKSIVKWTPDLMEIIGNFVFMGRLSQSFF